MILIRIDLFIRLIHRLELRIQKSIWLSSDNSGNFLTNKINKYSTTLETNVLIKDQNSGNQIFFFFFFLFIIFLSPFLDISNRYLEQVA